MHERILRFSLLLTIILLLANGGCSKKEKEEPLVCNPTVVSIEETEGIVLNGRNGEIVGVRSYESGRSWGFVNFWENKSNPKDFIVFINEKDFVWLRVDEDDYGYLYAGVYEYSEEHVHMVLYANNEIIEEHYYQYWFTTYTVKKEGFQFEFVILHLKDREGKIMEYYETKVYDYPYGEN